MSKGILVFIEHRAGALNKSSLEAIAAAQTLGSALQQAAVAVVLGDGNINLPQEIASHDLEKVVFATKPLQPRIPIDAGSLEAAIAMEDRNQVLCSRSEDFNEGIRAFLEKRKPVYIRR